MYHIMMSWSTTEYIMMVITWDYNVAEKFLPSRECTAEEEARGKKTAGEEK